MFDYPSSLQMCVLRSEKEQKTDFIKLWDPNCLLRNCQPLMPYIDIIYFTATGTPFDDHISVYFFAVAFMKRKEK